MEHLVRCVSLLIGVLGCYCYTGVFTEEDACKSELFQKAKVSSNPGWEQLKVKKNIKYEIILKVLFMSAHLVFPLNSA